MLDARKRGRQIAKQFSDWAKDHVDFWSESNGEDELADLLAAAIEGAWREAHWEMREAVLNAVRDLPSR